jgi:hypothetical protein
MNALILGPKARHVIARPEGPGNGFPNDSQGLKGRHEFGGNHVPPLQGGGILSATFTWGFTPGCHISGFQPFDLPPLAEQRRIVAELDALPAEVDALKRLQAETARGQKLKTETLK